jgi:phosphate transport system protein
MDAELARSVVERESEVNAQDSRLEELVVSLLARRQPMGNDLRVTLGYLKSGTDLERCGDEAKKIAKVVLRMRKDDLAPGESLGRVVQDMGDVAVGLLRNTLNALHDGDAALAVSVAEGDELLDNQYRAALRSFHEHLDLDESVAQVVTELVLVVKGLERVGDHATNIARYVIFAVSGHDVRHIRAGDLRDQVASRQMNSGPGH